MAEYVISLYHDTRREKFGKIYPVKLRVYFDYKTKFYPVGIDLTEEDFNRAYKSERPRGEYRDLRKKLLNAQKSRHLCRLSLPLLVPMVIGMNQRLCLS